MNILKKAIAPITDAGWAEIKDRTKKIFELYNKKGNYFSITP